jgi:hypothetical protein
LREIEDKAKSDDKPGKPTSAVRDVTQKGERHRWLDRSTKLLGNLCDLQLLTGTAAIIAALVQGEALSFYHRAIILNYWWLVLNSFWAARQDEDGMWEEPDSSQTRGTRQRHRSSDHASTPLTAAAIRLAAFFRGTERFRSYFRRLLVFICTTLFCILNGRATATENLQWDSLHTGRCYISHDKSAQDSDWFWLVGLVLYALVLLLTLVNKTKKMISTSSNWLRSREDQLFQECVRKWRCLRASAPIYAAGACVVFVGVVSLTIIYSACLQFAATWWFGGGFYALEVAVYMGMWAWSFYDIIDLKVSNRRLVVGNETGWGFGQVLAVVLMGSLIFYVVDGLGEEKEEERGSQLTSV